MENHVRSGESAGAGWEWMQRVDVVVGVWTGVVVDSARRLNQEYLGRKIRKTR